MRKLWEKAVDFHGHECPGLATGVRVSELAKEVLGIDFSLDEELVCITENDACGVDGIQVLTGCTFGKGNLLHKEVGKSAYTFLSRKSGRAFRFVRKELPEGLEREEKQEFILTAPGDEVFTWEEMELDFPEKAKIFDSISCEVCGEKASENKMRLEDGKKVCLDCFSEYSRKWL